MSTASPKELPLLQTSDWELDFYSRPIIETDGKKRWELLITSSENLTMAKPFRWEKRCPAGEVNSIWLSEALEEAIEDAKKEGWGIPLRLRCWRASMKTMITKAATKVGIEVIASRRTFSLLDWLAEREKDFYPKQEGYITGPIAPPPSPILNEPEPLPEAVRGDAWSFAWLPLGSLHEANEWPIEFSGLLPIKESYDLSIPIPGLRLFSKTRALALAGWLGGLEPVKLVIEGNQLLLEAGQDDRWLVTDMTNEASKEAKEVLIRSREKAGGIQFISVQSTPEEKVFKGFWMLKDIAGY
ncbi:Tab2/Atab2 family RNA-binding protein [Prochlorococcus sp. MIT 1307]|uniref:Tab2/Atab2 family RNA-binding protein n=1 Tax=Prochlorococcus sp. MIT 1307 TaxID=3096219 RepID=UPI002A749669|nr:Tab2/Atab2 family RNA-binding protein [Prochlorococcus sp. MIT 1307]